MNFMYALAGGLGEVGDAYSKEQEKQRDYNLEQRKAKAEMDRKENFARLGQTISQENAKYQQGLNLETQKQKALLDETKAGKDQTRQQENYAYQKSLDKSGMYDPKTKKQLTNEEVENHPNPETLIPAADYEAEQKTTRGIEGKETIRTAEIERLDKALADGQITEAEHKRAKSKAMGIPVAQKTETGEMTPGDIKAEKKEFRKNKVSQANKLIESGEVASNNRPLAELLGAASYVSSLDDATISQLVKEGDTDTINALTLPSIIDEMQGWNKLEVIEELKAKRIGGKPLTKAQKDLVMNALENKEAFAGFFQRSKKPQQQQ